jgi:hypothetical protein
MFQKGDRVVYHATPRYRGDSFSIFEGVEGVVEGDAYGDCYMVMFEGQSRTWSPAEENLHLVEHEVVWEV